MSGSTTRDADLIEATRLAFIEKYHTADPEYARKVAGLEQHLDSLGGDANPEWLAARKHRITGSNTGGIVGYNPYCSADDVLERMLRPSFTPNECTQWGNDHEDDAEASFAEWFSYVYMSEHPEIKSFHLRNAGLMLCTTPGMGWAGMSPDGLLDLWFEDGTQETWLVEYKCPYKTRNRTDATLTKHMYPNSKIPDSTMLPRAPIPKYYYCQINWGMALLKLPKCFFVVWSPAPVDGPPVTVSKYTGGAKGPWQTIAATRYGSIEIVKVDFDKKFFDNIMYPRLHDFYFNRYVPDAVALELGYEVPVRAQPKKPWFGRWKPKSDEDKYKGKSPFSERKKV